MNIKLLKTLLAYDPVTGLFTWVRSNSKKRVVGTTAGTRHPHGYIRINIRRKMYYAHRLAWLYVHGKFPPQEIDHIDRDPSNNRISNLRLATHAQNASNAPKRRTNASGFKGAYRHQGRWTSRIQHNGDGIYLGVFDTAEEAHAAYIGASKICHKEFFHP
jgi:hypothetical protein